MNSVNYINYLIGYFQKLDASDFPRIAQKVGPSMKAVYVAQAWAGIGIMPTQPAEKNYAGLGSCA